MTDITKLLTEGKTYFWALRQVYEDPAAARATLAAAGIDIPTLLALKQLEPSIARFPAPVSARPDPRYLEVPLPPSGNVFFSSLVTEHGVEMGLEIFPEKVSWSFAHRETQIVTGGDTPLDILLVDGSTERKVARPGDISAIPAGTRITFNSSEEGGRFAHAHIFLLNLSNGENRTFYDVVSFLKLQQLDILGSSEGLPPLHEVHHRTEITDWSQLVSPRPGRSVQQPTWLRNGWKNREATRALDYYEGTKSAVVNSPDGARWALEAAVRVLGVDAVVPLGTTNMGGEDFAFYLEKMPGCFLRIGAREPGGEHRAAHTPRFYPAEDALFIGAAVLAQCARAAGSPSNG